LPDNVTGAGDLDGAVVVFVADQDLTVLQELGAVRVVELLRAPVVPYCQTISFALAVD
jgi:hypothetical protein